ncbi:MAG: hypothetical protein M1461_01475 [Nitrospirae bacterium]|nr:hypothetical protein [Nitrospirota bacterium]
MNYPKFIIRIGPVLIIFIGIVFLFYGNWKLASCDSHRLRWYTVAKTDLPEGTRISKDDLDTKLGRLHPSVKSFVPGSLQPIEQYTRKCFKANEVLDSNFLASHPKLIPDPSKVIAPVLVKPDSAFGLKPGMCLAFAKKDKMVASTNTSQKIASPQGFLLKAIIPATDKGGSTTLLVEISQQEVKVMQDIGTDVLTPVVLSCKDTSN